VRGRIRVRVMVLSILGGKACHHTSRIPQGKAPH
jgi:hypothetical protein